VILGLWVLVEVLGFGEEVFSEVFEFGGCFF